MVSYELKTPYRDGTTDVLFEPLDFIAKLAALGLPPQSWSTVIVRKRRIRDGEQTTQTGRDRHEVTAG
jgi:hypothetical protein